MKYRNLQTTILFIIFGQIIFGQKLNDTFYLKYHKSFKITESKVVDGIDVKLSFVVAGKDDNKRSTYNFIVDNISNHFKTLKFNEITDTVDGEKINDFEIVNLRDLSELSSCDLHTLLSDKQNIVLLKPKGNLFYRYKLKYWSTQRGWEYVRTD